MSYSQLCNLVKTRKKKRKSGKQETEERKTVYNYLRIMN